AIETVPFSFDSLIYWMGRCAPKLTGDRYFRAHWTWYCALAWSWLVGRACDVLFRVPASEQHIAGAADEPAPGERAVPGPMSSEIAVSGQFGSAATHPIDQAVEREGHRFDS